MNIVANLITVLLYAGGTLAAVAVGTVIIYALSKLIGYGFTMGKKRAEFDSKSFNSGDRNGS